MAGLQDYISSRPDACHGKACITGTGAMATVVLDSLAEGLVEEIIEQYLSREAVQAALLYAAELANERVVPSSDQDDAWRPETPRTATPAT